MQNSAKKTFVLSSVIFCVFCISLPAMAQHDTSSYYVDGTSFTYRQNGLNLSLDVLDSRGVLTRYLYNEFGRMTEEQSAERGSIQYTYDAVGNIVKQVSEGGLIFKYDYDEQNRMIKEVMKQNGVDRKVNHYSYDNCENGNGRLCKVVSDGNITKYAYNKTGNYTKVATKYVGENIFETTRYAYNARGQLEKLHYPTGLTVKYHYTDEGFVHKVTARYDKGEDKTIFVIAKNIRFDPVSNRLTNLKFGNELKLAQTYGSKQGLAKTELYQGRNLLDFAEYQRDETGKITSITRLNAHDNQSFTYDEIGNLVTEQTRTDTEGMKTISYSYDAKS